MGYDEIGQLTPLSGADGSQLVYAYDEARRVTSVTNGQDAVVNYSLDDMGGVTQTQISDLATAVLYEQSATFDELGRLLTSVGANAETRAFAYDKVSNLISKTAPRSGSPSMITSSSEGPVIFRSER